jgi:hypothetical protein
MISEKQKAEAEAIVNYIQDKAFNGDRKLSLQETYDLQRNINTLFLYRIEQLEIKVSNLGG